MSQEAEILSALDAWKAAMIAKDADALAAVLHDDLVYSHSNAKAEYKANLLEKTNREGGAQAIEFSNARTKVFGDSAYVRADVDYTNRGDDGLDSVNYLNVLHVFVKAEGRWQMVARQAVRRSES